MSYSFSVKGASADEAAAKVGEEMAKVVESQPVHSADREQAIAAATSFLKLLRAPKEDEQVYASVNGSVWAGDSGLHSASVSVSSGFVKKE